jgi:hypothetical protein
MRTTLHPSWQEINYYWHSCHWWQEVNARMISAMTTILILTVLFIALAALVDYARHDRFAGSGNVAESHDELGSLYMRGSLVPRH